MTQQEKLTGSLAENLLALIAFSEKSCELVRACVDPMLFSSAMFRDIVQRFYGYIDQFHRPPGKEHFADLCEDILDKSDQNARLCEDILSHISQLSGGINEEYVLGQLEAFVRQQSLKVAVVRATESLSEGDVTAAELALEKGLERRLQLFEPGLTLEAGLDSALYTPRVDIVRLGIKELDEHNLGPARGELAQFIAPPKRGKTWFLIHVAKQALVQRLNVLYITLEISDKLIWQRMMQCFFAVQKKRGGDVDITRILKDGLGRFVKFEKDKIYDRLAFDDRNIKAELSAKISGLYQKGNLIIKRFPSGQLSTKDLEAYLDALERRLNFTVDVLIVDYVDLMEVDVDNFRIALGQNMVNLRGIAVDRNLAAVTAKKSNREGSRAKLVTSEHSGEDFSGAFTVDTTFTYTQTQEEREFGLARVFVDSTRVGDDDKFVLVIAQAYKVGQFVLPHFTSRLPDTYFSHIQALKGGAAPATP